MKKEVILTAEEQVLRIRRGKTLSAAHLPAFRWILKVLMSSVQTYFYSQLNFSFVFYVMIYTITFS